MCVPAATNSISALTATSTVLSAVESVSSKRVWLDFLAFGKSQFKYHQMFLAQDRAAEKIRSGCEVKKKICSYFGRAESIHRTMNLSLSADFSFVVLWCNAEISPFDLLDK